MIIKEMQTRTILIMIVIITQKLYTVYAIYFAHRYFHVLD